MGWCSEPPDPHCYVVSGHSLPPDPTSLSTTACRLSLPPLCTANAEGGVAKRHLHYDARPCDSIHCMVIHVDARARTRTQRRTRC